MAWCHEEWGRGKGKGKGKNSGWYDHSGYDWWDSWQDWHGEGGGYYGSDEAWEEEDPAIEVDWESFEFSLDEKLEPRDRFEGIQFKDQDFVFALDDDDVEDELPEAWQETPLKVHPEPLYFSSSSSASEKSSATPTSSVPAASPSPGRGTALSTSSSASDADSVSPPAHVTSGASDTSSDCMHTGQTGQAKVPTVVLAALEKADDQSSSSSTTSTTAASPTSGPAPSPKVILQADLFLKLKLKMKMMALKEKHNSPPSSTPSSPLKAPVPAEPLEVASPMSEPSAAASSDTESSASEEPEEPEVPAPPPSRKRSTSETDASTPRARSSGRPTKKYKSADAGSQDTLCSTCPSGHRLRPFKTPEPDWFCSVCRRDFPKASYFYGCRECEHDECERCAMRQPKAAAEAVATTPSRTSKRRERSRSRSRTPAARPKEGARARPAVVAKLVPRKPVEDSKEAPKKVIAKLVPRAASAVVASESQAPEAKRPERRPRDRGVAAELAAERAQQERALMEQSLAAEMAAEKAHFSLAERNAERFGGRSRVGDELFRRALHAQGRSGGAWR